MEEENLFSMFKKIQNKTNTPFYRKGNSIFHRNNRCIDSDSMFHEKINYPHKPTLQY